MTARGDAIRECAAGLDGRWRDLLREIVDINSGFTNLPGQRLVFEALAPHFEQLGLRRFEITLDGGRTAMVFERPDAAPELLLVGHVDTMFQPDSQFQSLARSGDVLTGPGVSDMKAGLVLMLMLLNRIRDPHLLRRIRIFINDDEELGARYSRCALAHRARDVRFALIFEPGLKDGAYVLAYSAEERGSEASRSRTAMRYYECDEIAALATHLAQLRERFDGSVQDPLLPAPLQRRGSERLSASGCVMVVGLGPYGGKTHTADEYLRPETFAQRLDAAVSLACAALGLEGAAGWFFA